MFDIRSLSQFLGVSNRIVRWEYSDSKIAWVKIAGKMRFRENDVKDYLSQNYFCLDIHESINPDQPELPLKKPLDTAIELGIPPTTLRLRKDEGQIKYLRIRGQIRYRPADILEFKQPQTI